MTYQDLMVLCAIHDKLVEMVNNEETDAPSWLFLGARHVGYAIEAELLDIELDIEIHDALETAEAPVEGASA